MSIGAYFEKSGPSGFLRCDRPAVARRQLEISLGLVVVLVLATFTALVTMPGNGASRGELALASGDVAVKRSVVIHAPVRIIPIFNLQAATRTVAGAEVD